MIIENMTSKMLFIISLSLTANEKWKAAGSFTSSSKVEGLFTVLAMIALIIAIVLMFWVFSRNKRAEHELNIKITELTVNNIKLRQDNNELKTDNEKLRQENAELSREKIEILENRINTEKVTK
jgi:uncharacterized protein HemX